MRRAALLLLAVGCVRAPHRTELPAAELDQVEGTRVASAGDWLPPLQLELFGQTGAANPRSSNSNCKSTTCSSGTFVATGASGSVGASIKQGARLAFDGATGAKYLSSNGTALTLTGLSLIPSADVTYNLGSAAKAWNAMFALTLNDQFNGAVRMNWAVSQPNSYYGDGSDGAGATAHRFANLQSITASPTRYVARFYRDSLTTEVANISTSGIFTGTGLNLGTSNTTITNSAGYVGIPNLSVTNSAAFAVGILSSVASGSNGFACTVNGCRVDLGTGAYDYFYSDGSRIVTLGTLYAETLDSTTHVSSDLFTGVGNGNPLQVKSTQADGAGSKGTTVNTSVAYTTTGAKLLAVQNNGTDKATVDKDGSFRFTGLATGSFPACAAGIEGALQYDTTTHKMRVCDGTNWVDLH